MRISLDGANKSEMATRTLQRLSLATVEGGRVLDSDVLKILCSARVSSVILFQKLDWWSIRCFPSLPEMLSS